MELLHRGTSHARSGGRRIRLPLDLLSITIRLIRDTKPHTIRHGVSAGRISSVNSGGRSRTHRTATAHPTRLSFTFRRHCRFSIRSDLAPWTLYHGSDITSLLVHTLCQYHVVAVILLLRTNYFRRPRSNIAVARRRLAQRHVCRRHILVTIEPR